MLCGIPIVITIKDVSNNTFRVFLSKIYFYVFTGEVINNTKKEKYNHLLSIMESTRELEHMLFR